MRTMKLCAFVSKFFFVISAFFCIKSIILFFSNHIIQCYREVHLYKNKPNPGNIKKADTYFKAEYREEDACSEKNKREVEMSYDRQELSLIREIVIIQNEQKGEKNE